MPQLRVSPCGVSIKKLSRAHAPITLSFIDPPEPNFVEAGFCMILMISQVAELTCN